MTWEDTGHEKVLEALENVVKDKDLDKENYVDIANDMRIELSY